LLVVTALAPPLTVAATPSRDAQIWSEADFIGFLSKQTTLTGILIGRAGESVPNPTLTALGLQLDQKFRHWSIGLGYRRQAVRHSTGGPDISRLAIAVAAFREDFGRSAVQIRTRIDNTLHSSGNPWRFRLRAEYRWATPGMRPISYLFLNDEAFYSAGEWSRNRAQGGLGLNLGRGKDLQVYYQWQNDRISNPARINALGLHFDMKFD